MDERLTDLAETIQVLRSQLNTAMTSGTDDGVRFQLGEVVVDFEVAVSRELGADGGIRFGVVSFGAKGAAADQRTHRITLTMQPVVVAADGRATPALVAGKAAEQPV